VLREEKYAQNLTRKTFHHFLHIPPNPQDHTPIIPIIIIITMINYTFVNQSVWVVVKVMMMMMMTMRGLEYGDHDFMETM
jgi:hypothetical protein